MTFDAKSLGLLAHSANHRIWHYKTADAAAAVDTAGYFNGAAKYVQVGDFIHAHVGVGGTPGYGIFVVNANDGSTVDVADMLNAAAADTD